MYSADYLEIKFIIFYKNLTYPWNHHISSHTFSALEAKFWDICYKEHKEAGSWLFELQKQVYLQ